MQPASGAGGPSLFRTNRERRSRLRASPLIWQRENVDLWDQQFPGRFVVVKERQLLGTFAMFDEALAAGAREYGLSDFLVRQLGRAPETVSIPALSLGLLGAHP